MMKLSKSIKIACAQIEVPQYKFASLIDVTPEHLSRVCSINRCPSALIEKMAEISGLSVSEFIALGE